MNMKELQERNAALMFRDSMPGVEECWYTPTSGNPYEINVILVGQSHMEKYVRGPLFAGLSLMINAKDVGGFLRYGDAFEIRGRRWVFGKAGVQNNDNYVIKVVLQENIDDETPMPVVEERSEVL